MRLRSRLALLVVYLCLSFSVMGCTTSQLDKVRADVAAVAARACAEIPNAEAAAKAAEAATFALPDGTDAVKAREAAAKARLIVSHLKSACALVPATPPVQ